MKSLPLTLILASAAQAFLIKSPSSSTTTTGRSPRKALIYGWDDATDETTSTPSYVVASPFDTGVTCDAAGTAVAASLSVDPDRVGVLARLAVAFAPSSGLALDQIERVEIACVARDHIDLTAMICQDGGCVSLAVPVTFPQQCDLHDGGTTTHHNDCVQQNLDALDTSATSTLDRQKSTAVTSNQAMLLDAPIEASRYPPWWVETPGAFQSECQAMRSILNEDDFVPEIRALAQGAAASGVNVVRAKVATVGPAGLAFQAVTQTNNDDNKDALVTPVFYRFTQAPENPDALRAAILGAVATAEA